MLPCVANSSAKDASVVPLLVFSLLYNAVWTCFSTPRTCAGTRNNADDENDVVVDVVATRCCNGNPFTCCSSTPELENATGFLPLVGLERKLPPMDVSAFDVVVGTKACTERSTMATTIATARMMIGRVRVFQCSIGRLCCRSKEHCTARAIGIVVVAAGLDGKRARIVNQPISQSINQPWVSTLSAFPVKPQLGFGEKNKTTRFRPPSPRWSCSDVEWTLHTSFILDSRFLENSSPENLDDDDKHHPTFPPPMFAANWW